ncbi:hypothetical protein B0H14DRAFT_3454725 [Mycena olivaceomarginata]|nr:hypothetical protein B0H14DRAFT_3454725 [Mycena olivaceomarginata]
MFYHVPVLPERPLDQMGMVEGSLEFAHHDFAVVTYRGDGDDVAGALEGDDLFQDYNQRVRNGSLREGGIGDCGGSAWSPRLGLKAMDK